MIEFKDIYRTLNHQYKTSGVFFYKRQIFSHHKNLNRGDFLIDDREKNGAKDFRGELIRFGSERFPDWNTVTEYLLKGV